MTDTLQAYNNNDGIFAAPITGMYVFFWTTAVKQYERTQLLVNGVPYGYASADAANDGDTDYGSASQIVVLKVSSQLEVQNNPDLFVLTKRPKNTYKYKHEIKRHIPKR